MRTAPSVGGLSGPPMTSRRANPRAALEAEEVAAPLRGHDHGALAPQPQRDLARVAPAGAEVGVRAIVEARVRQRQREVAPRRRHREERPLERQVPAGEDDAVDDRLIGQRCVEPGLPPARVGLVDERQPLERCALRVEVVDLDAHARVAVGRRPRGQRHALEGAARGHVEALALGALGAERRADARRALEVHDELAGHDAPALDPRRRVEHEVVGARRRPQAPEDRRGVLPREQAQRREVRVVEEREVRRL
jgi:hypothetical protein